MRQTVRFKNDAPREVSGRLALPGIGSRKTPTAMESSRKTYLPGSFRGEKNLLWKSTSQDFTMFRCETLIYTTHATGIPFWWINRNWIQNSKLPETSRKSTANTLLFINFQMTLSTYPSPLSTHTYTQTNWANNKTLQISRLRHGQMWHLNSYLMYHKHPRM